MKCILATLPLLCILIAESKYDICKSIFISKVKSISEANQSKTLKRNLNVTLMLMFHLSGTSEAKSALETAKQAINAADDALLLYSKMIAEISLPKTANELTSELMELHLPVEKGLLVIDIKNKLNYGLSEYVSAARDIYEAFHSTSLNIYIKLFDQNDDSRRARQKDLLLNFLNHVISSLNSTQIKLNNTSAEFKASIEKLTVLQADGGSEPIKTVCDRLKDRYAKIFAVIDESNEKLKDKTKAIEDLTSQLQEATVNPTTNDYAELRNSFIQSAQKLIADSNEYRQKHLNVVA